MRQTSIAKWGCEGGGERDEEKRGENVLGWEDWWERSIGRLGEVEV